MHQLTDTNPKIAEKKAELGWRLGMMCRKPPQSIGSAGVMKTREWLALRRRGMVLLGGGRTSVRQLAEAIDRMGVFET
jgi:hypothetical protein